MDGTILGQGTFVASAANLTNPNAGNASVGTANATIIQIPSNADWVSVKNYTQSGTAGTSGAYFNGTANAYVGMEFYWQRGMATGTGIVRYYGNAGQAINGDTLVSGGFTLYDPSGQSVGAQPLTSAPVAVSAVTNATRPVVTHTADTTVQVGSIVRLNSTAQSDVNGVDMVVGAVGSSTSFTLLFAGNALATAPGAIGGAGYYTVVNFDPLYYPRRRFISKITQATNAQVSTTVAHQYVPGQAVRFNIPAVSGMTQLNPTSANNYLYATVLTVVDSYNFTINVNTSAFTAFTWPTIAQMPASFPEVTPLGEDTATALLSATSQVPVDYLGNPIFNANSGILSDSTVNTGYLGMILGNGGNGTVLTTPILGPSGSIAWSAGNVATGDTMYWLAGKSTYGGL
jgi:hypothetical protein